MAIPSSTTVWTQSMDPYDIVDYIIDCSKMLEEGENISTYTVSLLAEASLLGLTINNSGGYSTTLISGNRIRVWLSILPAEQSNPIFVNAVTLPLEVTITTSSTPPRRKQRTVAVTVQQQ